jgi:hypothetical protein
MRVVSTILTAFLILLLLASAYLGLTGGIPLVREAHTAARALATGTELLYGVAALLALVALANRYRWSFRVLIVWAAGLTATSGLAPVVWGNTSVRTGVVSGAVAGVVLALILWAWHFAQSRAALPVPHDVHPSAGAGGR